MGVKARIFAPQASLTLNDLVPHEHFYRHLERSLDLGFVRRCGYQRVSDFWVSTTDPDATLMRQHGQSVKLRYRTHYIMADRPGSSSRLWSRPPM